MAYTSNPVFPFGPASTETLTSAATIAVEVNNTMNILTVALDTNTTINLTVDPETKVGSMIVLKAASDGTARSVTPGTGMTGAAISGTINKTKAITFVYDGSTFVHVATQQID